MRRVEIPERLEKNTDKRTPTECWPWKGRVDTKGYGLILMRRNGRMLSFRAHRCSYEQYKGPIPVGLELDHLCRVLLCVNPNHLEPVTHAENMRRSGPYKRAAQCKRGHDLTGTNRVTFSSGKSRCLACKLDHNQAWKAAHYTPAKPRINA